MELIKNIFWNGEQSRLRSGYRLVLQLALGIGIAIGLQAVVKYFAPGIKFNAGSPLWFFLAYAGILLCSGLGSVWIIGRLLDKRPFSGFGFHFNKEWWIDFTFGIGLGIVLMSLIFLIEYANGWVKITSLFYTNRADQNFVIPLLIVLLVFICVSIREETTTRGYLLKNLSEGLNVPRLNPQSAVIISWLFSSALFGYYHFGNPNATWVSTANIAMGGVFLGMAYVMTGELAIPIGLHISWNFFQGNVFGFPVSGLTIPADLVTFIKIEQLGPDSWTGGAFGPEGGLVGTTAIILGCIFTYVWIRLRKGKENARILSSLAMYKT